MKPSELTDTQLNQILEHGSGFYELEHENTGPGKFEGNGNPGLAAAIYDRSIQGWNEDETGSVQWDVHVSLLGRFLLIEDDRGFVTLDESEHKRDARKKFEWWEREYEQDMDDDEA